MIAAGKSGKSKALFQNMFIGALLLWYPLFQTAVGRGWTAGSLWPAWAWVHGAFIAVTLMVALVLTIYSMGLYFWRNRGLAGSNR